MLTEQRVTTEALTRLAETLESLDLGPGAGSLAADRDRLAGTIRSYLIPRVLDPDTPMTVVVAGPTGSGKSTVVNSLSGTDLSLTGAIRPTTRRPVVLTAPGRETAYEMVGGVRCETFAVDAPMLESMVLVDAPDIDSTSTSHRAMAEVLIDNADVVVFVTSALRYADDVPWQILRRARSRGAPVVHVLNRVQPASAGSAIDFKSRLSAAGMDDRLVMISEHHLADGDHRLPNLAVRSLRDRLTGVAANREAFASDVFHRVVSATLTQIIELVDQVADLQTEIDIFETRMSDGLTRRVADLSLREIGEGLFPIPPESTSRRDARKWRKRSVMPKSDIAATESSVVARIVTAVTSDIRRWLVEQNDMLRERDIEPTPAIDSLVSVARSAAEGWVAYVARIADDSGEREVWLGEAVLIQAATIGELTTAAELVFAESGPVLVDRARRELVGRLEVVYQHFARLLADILRDRHGEANESDLRASIGAVTATLAPIDA